MAGETIKTEAVCLAIHPWSRTSHVVRWMTPDGPLVTLVKGAVRPKSAFLGQYDLNYTCEIVYYARGKGDIHALRECTPLKPRERLRGDYRALVLAGYMRAQVAALTPHGPDAADWLELLEDALDALPRPDGVRALVQFELRVLALAGLSPELEAEAGSFTLRGERQIPVPPEVARCIRRPEDEKNPQILLDAARVIGVFYSFHVDSAPEARRIVLRMISNTEEEGTGNQDG